MPSTRSLISTAPCAILTTRRACCRSTTAATTCTRAIWATARWETRSISPCSTGSAGGQTRWALQRSGAAASRGRRRGRLLVDPEAREGRRPVAVVPADRERSDVAQMRLEREEAAVVRHPHPGHLVELAVDDLLGEGPLLSLVRRSAQLGDELINHRVVHPEVVLRGLGVHVLVGL